MLSPDYLASCADDVVKLYAELDESIIKLMAQRIARIGIVSDYSVWQAEMLQESGMLYDDIIKEVSSITGTSEKRLEQLFKDAGIRTIEADNAILAKAGLPVTPIKLSPRMTQVLVAGLRKTNKQLKNLTLTTAITTQQAYISACNLAYMQVSSGFSDYASAVARVVRQAAADGTVVLYPTGHKDQLDVAVRRSVVTGVNQTAANVQLNNLAELGCDLVEVTAHAGARPEHAEWQGKVFSLSGKTKGYKNFYEATGYGTGPGLCGWNCRHNFYPFFEGLSERNYTDDELQELRDSKDYENEQQQRYMERSIRKTKRTLAGYDAAMSAAPDEATRAAIKQKFDRASVRLKDKEAKLKEFCREKGLPLDGSRVQAPYGAAGGAGFGRSTAQKAVWANRKSQQSVFSDIANEKLFEITKESIERIPLPNCKTLTDEANKRLQNQCRELLRDVKDQIIGTEAGRTLDMNGDLLHYKVGKSGDEELKMRSENVPYVLIHNHPDGNIFSARDINRFVDRDNLKILVATGNNGSLYVVEKLKEYDELAVKSVFCDIIESNSKRLKESPQDHVNVVESFLKEASNYGIRLSTG